MAARGSRAARSAGRGVLLGGSLTQPGARDGFTCTACGSVRVTRIEMSLTDGSPVEFTSCYACEHRTWTSQGSELPVTTVIDKTRKRR